MTPEQLQVWVESTSAKIERARVLVRSGFKSNQEVALDLLAQVVDSLTQLGKEGVR